MTSKNDIIKAVNDSVRYIREIEHYNIKAYIYSLLLLKKISDRNKEIEPLVNGELICSNKESSFDFIYSHKDDEDLASIMNSAFKNLEKKNSDRLKGVFDIIDFTNFAVTVNGKDKNHTLKKIVDSFNNLDLRPSCLDSANVITDALEIISDYIAMLSRRDTIYFETPNQIAKLVSSIVKPQENEEVYDPTCGTGGMLINAYKEAVGGNVSIYGQEINKSSWSVCILNMLLHDIDTSHIWLGDSIQDPMNIENGRLMKFDVVIANPSFTNVTGANAHDTKLKSMELKAVINNDKYNRFPFKIFDPKGDFTFLQHMLSCLDEKTGRMAALLPAGVLSRGAVVQNLRKAIVDMNLLDTVIVLPSGILHYTITQMCIMVFKKNRISRDVLFIDASGSDSYDRNKNNYVLKNDTVKRIVKVYQTWQNEDKFSHIASFDEIKNNNYNLNIPLYVDTFEEDLIDINSIKINISNITKELQDVQAKIDNYIKDISM
ncbi:Probable type I restriction enzyme BthVORF4518P M protein [Anaerobiospirillum thomasii]|uniref:site-specific DNA-methyltransferase (adenine-specific) n=2 Tax=Anaerobiospirillum thomasii TaxID=179995 RepID=A0A2X0WSS9_9GAMM|nr:class I SAM-dependent DNA methyltransferase [Anaerobiospirillum thomasii]SPT68501.1 Probable type I restriction enzyme BthVORF4518P M protein [Anaerobiospirillum thomasii]SPT71027.1 Probable type I restriction enzyme BthVORF4518P M protein [Anaerobiospirillum thomasii]